MKRVVVGIDLGTTNSSVAVVDADGPRVLEVDGEALLPSAVGFDADGALLVGRSARNQRHVAPERTALSFKRLMGSDAQIQLGEGSYTPIELSGMLLRRLVAGAERALGCSISGAVITVPAYFDEHQRAATRQAGEVAGLNVLRILNEPTAAALCYGAAGAERTVLVYDLGGGTFDVSVVRDTGPITKVLASCGDAKLGGDDFDSLLMGRMVDVVGAGALSDLRGKARLRSAAEAAKIELSDLDQVEVIEEALYTDKKGVARHLDMVVERAEFEGLIEPLLQKTRDSVHQALENAGLLVSDIDEVLLVGGSTRTPCVSRLLFELTQMRPRADVDPDQAVALGAALHAARLAGDDAQAILVDISPYTYGIRALEESIGGHDRDAFGVVIKKGSALPCSAARTFATVVQGQQEVHVEVYQGDSADVTENLRIGRFVVDGLSARAPESSPLDFVFDLSLDGLLRVLVREPATGLEHVAVIEDAFGKLGVDALREAQARLKVLIPDVVHEVQPDQQPEASAEASGSLSPEAADLVARAEGLLDTVDALDREELEEAVGKIYAAEARGDGAALAEELAALGEALFYLEA